MKNRYLLITDNSHYTVEAVSWQHAMVKFYDYFGETNYITVADFEMIINKKSLEDSIKLFTHLIGCDYILFFGIIQEQFVNEMIDIDARVVEDE